MRESEMEVLLCKTEKKSSIRWLWVKLLVYFSHMQSFVIVLCG